MKKIVVLAMGVLLCTQVFAIGTDDPESESSSMGVTLANGSKLVKVFYKTPRLGNVKVTIYDEDHSIVFAERMKHTNGFMRPYNFEGQKEGEYTIQIADAFGVHTEKVNYIGGRFKTLVHFGIISGDERRFVLTGRAHGEDKLVVRFYDDSHMAVYEEQLKVEGEFGQVYNLKSFPGPFTLEVSDEHGIITKASY